MEPVRVNDVLGGIRDFIDVYTKFLCVRVGSMKRYLPTLLDLGRDKLHETDSIGCVHKDCPGRHAMQELAKK